MRLISFLLFMVGFCFLIWEYSGAVSPKVLESFHPQKKESIFTTLSRPFSKFARHFVRLSTEKRDVLALELKTVGMTQQPEEFVADNLGLALLITLIGCPVIFVSPILVVISPILGVVVYFSESKAVTRKLQEKRQQIELELPRFSSTISTALCDNKTTDVLKILESYRKIAGAALKSELETTIADIKTGNLQNALRNFENRINSHKLSELIRGLLSVSYGDNQSVYFQIKENEFRQEYREIKKREIEKRPDKLSGISLLTMLCAVALLIIALTGDIMSSVETLF